MADNKQAFQAGQTAGKAEEKSNVLLDKVKDSAAAVQTSAGQAGQKIAETATGAFDVVKDKTGLGK